MAFALLLSLTANLFIRPAELVDGLRGLPLYNFNIVAAGIAALPSLARKLSPTALRRDPITLCVLGLLLAVPVSHLFQTSFWAARNSFENFSKTILYYFIFVSVVTTYRRLEVFLTALSLILATMAGLSLAHYNSLIHLPELDSFVQNEYDPTLGTRVAISRLRSTGLFNDPNDFAMVLVIGITLCFYKFGRARLFATFAWILVAILFGTALTLTKSRGGMLALFASLSTLAYAKWGFKRAAIAATLLMPVIAAGFATRSADALEEGTGQSRIQLWSDGFVMMKGAPLFGIGQNMFSEQASLVAHNSFLHCYVELGVFGGTAFFGAFYFAVTTLIQQSRSGAISSDPFKAGCTSTALAIAVGAATSMLSLSRAYVVPTYMVLAIAATTVQINCLSIPERISTFGVRMALRLAVASCCFLVVLYIITRTFVRWS